MRLLAERGPTRSSSRRTTARSRWTVRSACRATARRRPTCVTTRPAGNLGFNPKEVFAITKPEQAHLPKSNITSTLHFRLTTATFFVYPNDTNQFRPLLQRYVPARRRFDGGDDHSLHRHEAEVAPVPLPGVAACRTASPGSDSLVRSVSGRAPADFAVRCGSRAAAGGTVRPLLRLPSRAGLRERAGAEIPRSVGRMAGDLRSALSAGHAADGKPARF